MPPKCITAMPSKCIAAVPPNYKTAMPSKCVSAVPSHSGNAARMCRQWNDGRKKTSAQQERKQKMSQQQKSISIFIFSKSVALPPNSCSFWSAPKTTTFYLCCTCVLLVFYLSTTYVLSNVLLIRKFLNSICSTYVDLSYFNSDADLA